MNIELVEEIRELVLQKKTKSEIMEITAMAGKDINFIIRLDNVLTKDWENKIKLLNDDNIQMKLDIKSQDDNLTLISKLQKDIVSLQNRDLAKEIITKEKEFRNLEKDYLKDIRENERELKDLNDYISKIPKVVKNFLPNE